MIYIIIVLSLLVILLALLSLFLAKEMFKKITNINQILYPFNRYIWLGKTHFSYSKPEMRNLIFTSDTEFTILIGIDLDIPLLYHGVDWYGYSDAEYDEEKNRWIAVISTWMGKKPATFRFASDTEMVYFHDPYNLPGIYERCTEPTKSFPPHWWQRIGLYA